MGVNSEQFSEKETMAKREEDSQSNTSLYVVCDSDMGDELVHEDRWLTGALEVIVQSVEGSAHLSNPSWGDNVSVNVYATVDGRVAQVKAYNDALVPPDAKEAAELLNAMFDKESST